METRYRELDALRGLAVSLMILYHLAFDLAFFHNIPLSVHTGFWLRLAQCTAALFLFVMGICFVISWERTQPSLYGKYLKRGLKIFAGGMIISGTTWFFAPTAFVKFGILHLIGVSALLQPCFVKLRRWNAVLGVLWIVIGIRMGATTYPFLFPVGMTTPGFASLDYYPLFPWFGIILLGMAAGYQLYVPTSRLPQLSTLQYPSFLLTCGRQALLIYFLHQPLLLAALALVFRAY